MKRRLLAAAVVAAAALLVPASAGAFVPRTFYVSLGDSLAAGWQPDVETLNEGYANQLYASIKPNHTNLRLIKLGCPGESTTTMLSGGKCKYGRGSQLAAATYLLRRFKNRVKVVTITLGANDLLPCNPTDIACTGRAYATLQANFPRILQALRAAAGSETRIVAMNYYAPGLVLWLTGPAGQAQAQSYVNSFVVPGNDILASIYRTFRIPVADVAAAFSTTDFATMVPFPTGGTVPLNVAKICQLTWMCAKSDIHANVAGHAVIAQTFAPLLE